MCSSTNPQTCFSFSQVVQRVTREGRPGGIERFGGTGLLENINKQVLQQFEKKLSEV